MVSCSHCKTVRVLTKQAAVTETGIVLNNEVRRRDFFEAHTGLIVINLPDGRFLLSRTSERVSAVLEGNMVTMTGVLHHYCRFGFAPSPVNFIRPGKRPQSSIASSIAEDLETGQFIMATGSAGGSRIITATLQELYHHLDQGLNGAHAFVHQYIVPQLTYGCPSCKHQLPNVCISHAGMTSSRARRTSNYQHPI